VPNSNSLKLAEIRKSLPPIDMAAQCATRLKQAMFDGITEADMGEIMKGLVKKAKEGDAKATKVLFETVLKASAAPQPVRMINAANANSRALPAHTGKLSPQDCHAVRVGCAQALGKEGPLNVEDLADETEFSEDEIAAALEHDESGWFEHQDNGSIRLTTVGRKEAMVA
jgi:hypothetical protein